MVVILLRLVGVILANEEWGKGESLGQAPLVSLLNHKS